MALIIAGCAAPTTRSSLPSIWMPSANHDLRRPSYVVLHHTGDRSAEDALATLTNPFRRVSAHYLVARDGTIYQLVDEHLRAWHAGASRWGMDVDMNSSSLGIELDNDGDEPYEERQIASLLALLADIAQRQRIPRANYLAHGDVAPGRKSDPGPLFPWKRLAERGFGLWCDAPYPHPPSDFDVRTGLTLLGYDPRRWEASLRAFRIHFRGMDSNAAVEPDDAALLHCLLLQRDQ